MTSGNKTDLENALAGLLQKYAVDVPGRWRLGDTWPPAVADEDATVLLPGWLLLAGPCPPTVVPLLPWRVERRFVELKRIVDGRTIDPVLMARLACLSDGGSLPLPALLYREFDLLQWLTGRSIERLYATVAAGEANVIARLDDGAIASIEVGTPLPAGSPPEDRHELIARRGVASDRAVDTQVRQESVYVRSQGGCTGFTDVDAELFGLAPSEVAIVRAAFGALGQPESHDRLRRRHAHLAALVDAASESDRRRQRVMVNETTGERAA